MLMRVLPLPLGPPRNLDILMPRRWGPGWCDLCWRGEPRRNRGEEQGTLFLVGFHNFFLHQLNVTVTNLQ